MDMIKLALDNGAEPLLLLFAGIHFKPTWKDKFNYTHPWAIGLEYVKTAVEYGADVNATQNNTEGKAYPALHWAYSNFNNRDISDFLMEKGASVDTPSPFNNSPLQRAVSDGKAELVEYYLEKGADPMRACGENKDNFPLKELQGSEKFKPDKKAALVMLMMKHTKPAQETPAAPEPQPANNEIVLAKDIEVSPPVTLKTRPPEKHAKNFSL